MKEFSICYDDLDLGDAMLGCDSFDDEGFSDHCDASCKHYHGFDDDFPQTVDDDLPF